MTPMRIDLPYLMPDHDRHGNLRIYVRRNSRKIRLREKPGTDAFAQAYSDALRALDMSTPSESPAVRGAPAGTLGWLAACYFASAEFRSLEALSRVARRSVLEDCLREPRKPGSADLMRDCPVSAVAAAHVKMLRDRKAGKPGAANNRRKYLSAMFGWAVEQGLMRSNPARESAACNTPQTASILGASTTCASSKRGIRSAPRRGSRSRSCSFLACGEAMW